AIGYALIGTDKADPLASRCEHSDPFAGCRPHVAGCVDFQAVAAHYDTAGHESAAVRGVPLLVEVPHHPACGAVGVIELCPVRRDADPIRRTHGVDQVQAVVGCKTEDARVVELTVGTSAVDQGGGRIAEVD